jgi:hypothetical protein
VVVLRLVRAELPIPNRFSSQFQAGRPVSRAKQVLADGTSHLTDDQLGIAEIVSAYESESGLLNPLEQAGRVILLAQGPPKDRPHAMLKFLTKFSESAEIASAGAIGEYLQFSGIIHSYFLSI